ncbi:thiamine-phosphate kinase [Paenibacillus glycanilyticus]|uniref:Thiamine-monophosphate kinase n=1 Tax=Paenibacillus glycanilyticus TaxID=126569 RepID=A0ABQ6G5N6_9BACL|nr:thiamine-phosphate kinase [Paenibacillus glycanilyticus]GLX66294.1 thiamine-monophosphate kinase [Paenibacillus glycanilyticus]
MDEFASIRHWTSGRQSEEWQRERGVRLGIGDDAALIDPAAPIAGVTPPYEYVLAMDTMVETVHFNETTMSYEDIGYKALASNISDIAAMGGVPLQALVSVSVPRQLGPELMRRLYDGLYACADQYGVAIIGGDTTSSPQHLVVAVTVTGAVEAGKALRRSGAQPGDAVVLTGPVGMSAAGLHFLLAQRERGADALAGERVAQLVQAHQRPAPSVRAGRLLLARETCHSLNDVSDGLASEAWEIAEASGLAVSLFEEQLPRSGSMTAYAGAAGIDPLEWMLYGGEDYVLLGSMELGDAAAAQVAFHSEGLPFYIIGETAAGTPAVELIRKTVKGELRQRLAKKGYNHFE